MPETWSMFKSIQGSRVSLKDPIDATTNACTSDVHTSDPWRRFKISWMGEILNSYACLSRLVHFRQTQLEGSAKWIEHFRQIKLEWRESLDYPDLSEAQIRDHVSESAIPGILTFQRFEFQDYRGSTWQGSELRESEILQEFVCLNQKKRACVEIRSLKINRSIKQIPTH